MADDNTNTNTNPSPNPPPKQESPAPPPPQHPAEPLSDPPASTEAPPPRAPEAEATAKPEEKQRLSEVLEVEREAPPAPEPEKEAAAALEVEEEKEKLPEKYPATAEKKEPEVSSGAEEPPVVEGEKGKSNEKLKVPESLVSFKEESNIVAELSDFERKALQELKQMVQEALQSKVFASPEKKEAEKPASGEEESKKPEEPKSESDASTDLNPPNESEAKENEAENSGEEVVIWGMPLLKDNRSDVILLKFLRARDFKVKDAFVMLKNTIQWRREFGIDALMDEELGDDLEKVVFMHGYDRDGHPVCYNVYGEFQNKELYQKTFGDEEKRTKFLRWRIQFLERSIRKLDFRPGGVNTIFQVNDLKNSPGPAKKELRIATKQALQILQDNYPEFVAKQVFINVPWWYLAFYTMINPFLTQRTKSKFVFAGPSKTAETLFKYVSSEQVPVQYGGLSVDYCDCNPEFTIADPATEMTIKPGTKQNVEIIVYEKCVLVWELRVVGWEVSYSAEFVPNAKDAYTVIMQKPKKMAPTDEPVVSSSFKVTELGKILLTIDNPTSKKKKLIYRFKVNPLSD